MGALFSCCKKQDKKKVKKSNKKDEEKKFIHAYSKDGVKKEKDQVGQDSYDSITTELGQNVRFIAVYDGHGLKGKEASQLARDEVGKQLRKDKNTISKFKERKDAEKYFKKLFNNVQNKYKKKPQDFESSGTCAICVLIVDTHCFIINLGDSRAVVGAKQVNQKVAYQMSIDHKANREDEKKRIEMSGGIVSADRYANIGPHRVYSKNEEGPGLAVSRSLGDLFGHTVGISAEPEVSYKELDIEDKFVVIGSDGIWDVMNSAEVVGYVFDKIDVFGREKVTENLVTECRNRWEVINLFKQKQQNEKNNQSSKDDKSINSATRVNANTQQVFTIDDITSIIAYFNVDDK